MDGTEEDTGNNKINPFEQPPILETLFKHIKQLPLEDLTNCRLVNTQWYNETFSAWRSNATLKFEGGGIVCTRDHGFGAQRLTPLDEFLDIWEACDWSSCPFKKFKLPDWSFRAVEEQRFLELVGGHITSLTLKLSRYGGLNRRIIYQAFPNLQFLKLDDDDFWHWVHQNDYFDNWARRTHEILEYKEPVFGVYRQLKSLELSYPSRHSIMELLTHFHELESLRLSLHGFENSMHGHGQAEYRKLLEVIRLIRAQDPTKLPLKNLDVIFVFNLGQHYTAASMQLLNLHEQLHLPLQRLQIWFYPESDMNPHVLRDILRYHSSTLKHLQFSGSVPNMLCRSFPFGINLENLEELFIPCHRFSDNLNYLKYTPKLRALEIKGITLFDTDILFSNSSQLEIGDWTLPTLTELRCEELPLSICNLENLMKWMPNVERLSLKLDDFQFSMVCNNKNWRHLKHFEDWGHELTDEGVIGTGNGFGAVGDDKEEAQRVPNISKLKNLTSFKSSSYKLTPASLQDEFLKLANLKKLTLWELRLDEKAIYGLRNPDIKPEVRYGEWW